MGEHSATHNTHLQLNGYGYLNYATAKVKTEDHTVKVSFPGPNDGILESTFWDGSKSLFKLAQFHVHAPSEHSVDGKLFDLEIHFVHTYADDPTHLGAVIGVFFDMEEGGEYDNPFLHEMLDFTGDFKVGTEKALPNGLDVLNFLSNLEFKKYWSYFGSLTTPPCTEGIRWHVLEQVQPISKHQLDEFTALWARNATYAGGNGNNREIQKLNGRTVYYTDGSGATFLTLSGVTMLISAFLL